jgi:hypothetical protein
MKRTLLVLTFVGAAILGTACAFESKSEPLLPTAPGTTTTPPPTNSSYAGTWTSTEVTVPTVGSCGDFQWHVTSTTATSMAGHFSATCANGTTIAGAASGELIGTSVAITVTGTGTYAGSVSCAFSLSGTGTVENNDTLVIPYTGTTCLGPVSGTARLRRPAPAAEPAPTPPPTPSPVDPLFGCGGIPNKEELVECIWDHIHPTDNNSAFEVTKRVAWALRGEGAGLLLKNGGDNITAWRGYLFSSSRICYPDGRLVKVIFDAGPGGANGPSWQDSGDYVSPSLYMPAIDPTLP